MGSRIETVEVLSFRLELPKLALERLGPELGPALLVQVERDEDGTIVYPPSEAAGRHGASVDEETSSPKVAYAKFEHWQRGRPRNWDALPWG